MKGKSSFDRAFHGCTAWGCDHQRIAYGNGAPNLSVDIPRFRRSRKATSADCRKRLQDRQTLLSLLAPAFKAACWAERLVFPPTFSAIAKAKSRDPGSFKTTEESKLGPSNSSSSRISYPELYKTIHHRSHHYYPPARRT